ncbi:hypothetical protein [Mesorhizobium sp. ORM16]|uniref:hypothetical protein n=1 Tax=Mesorhizobium sp. ORM16 TaxID=3376989 RepID=UPI003857C26C
MNRFDAKTEADRSCATKPDNLISYRHSWLTRRDGSCQSALNKAALKNLDAPGAISVEARFMVVVSNSREQSKEKLTAKTPPAR